MPTGRGRYDDLCAHVREEAFAHGAIVIIFDGIRGSGFSVQVEESMRHKLPGILEHMAQELRNSSHH